MAHTARQVLPAPPATYDQAYIAKLAEAVNRYMIELGAGELTAPRFICQDPVRVPEDLPDTKTLPTGTLYLRSLPAVASGTFADPGGVNNLTWILMGLGVRIPVQGTQGLVTISGELGNTFNGKQTEMNLAYGTGPSPLHGQSLSGTLIGQPVRYIASSVSDYTPFSYTALFSGLTPGTDYWVDAAIRVTGGFSILRNISIVASGAFDSSPAYFWTVVTKEDPL